MRYLFPILLMLFLSGCISNNSVGLVPLEHTLPDLLDEDIHLVYQQGKSILLFSDNSEYQNTEAYADWAAYLNDFKNSVGDKFILRQVKAKVLNELLVKSPAISSFSLFFKKGKPSYLYEDLIVEPQVYLAVEHVYDGVKLTAEDKAFLPDEVQLK